MLYEGECRVAHIVSDSLDIRIMNFEGAMMRSSLLHVHREEESVVINPFFFPVDVHEGRDCHAVRSGQEIGGFQVEVFGVEVVCPLEVRD